LRRFDSIDKIDNSMQ